jgi:hypothetical protein
VSEGRQARCEQLVYTSARRTLEGTGFGVLAHSPGWPQHLGLTGRNLGRLAAAPVSGDDEVALLRREGGALVYRKRCSGEDAMGRSGNYLVHLLWDPRGELTLREVVALLEGGALLDDASGLEPTPELPRLAVPLRPRQRLAATTTEAGSCVAAVLRLLQTGGQVELPASLPSGSSSLAVLSAALPRGLLELLSLLPADAGDLGQDAAVVALRLRPGAALEEPTEAARLVVEAADAGTEVPDSLASWAQLDRWLSARRWAAEDPSILSAQQVGTVLGSDEGERWLVRGGAWRAVEAAEADPGALRALRAAVTSSAARLLVAEAAARLLTDSLLAGRPTPHRTLRIGGLRDARLVEVMLTLQEQGGIDRLDDAGRRLLETALAASTALHPARLLHPGLLSELMSERPVVEAAVRSLATDDPLLRRRTAEALLAADPTWLGELEGRLSYQELHDLLADEAREADEDRLDQLVVAAVRLPGRRGFALRSLLAQAPAELAAAVLAKRGDDVLEEDGWPAALVREVEVSRRRSAWRRLAGRG